MRKLIAESKIRHNGKWFMPGQTFSASDDDAADLIAMKMARAETSTEKIVDAVESAAEAVTEAVTRSRRPSYRRRDLNSDES